MSLPLAGACGRHAPADGGRECTSSATARAQSGGCARELAFAARALFSPAGSEARFALPSARAAELACDAVRLRRARAPGRPRRAPGLPLAPPAARPHLHGVTLIRAIVVVLLISWAIGFAFLREYSPWIHAPLIPLAIAVYALLTHRRPRVRGHA